MLQAQQVQLCTTIVGGISVEQGKVYKIEIVVASGSSNANISISNGNNSVATGYIAYSEGSNIVYYTPSATTSLTVFKGQNGTRVWTIDSFSIKEVQMGNHATKKSKWATTLLQISLEMS
jgi:fructose-1,6-bisphosphatase